MLGLLVKVIYIVIKVTVADPNFKNPGIAQGNDANSQRKSYAKTTNGNGFTDISVTIARITIVDSQGNGGSAGVSIPIYADRHFISTYAYALGDILHNENIRLMQHVPVKATKVDNKIGFKILYEFRNLGNRKAENIGSIHVAVVVGTYNIGLAFSTLG